MRLSRRSVPFDSDDFIRELKIDTFRAVAHIQNGRGELVSSLSPQGICAAKIGWKAYQSYLVRSGTRVDISPKLPTNP